MTWLKQNWFKVFVAATLFIGVAYYIVFDLLVTSPCISDGNIIPRPLYAPFN
jgi:hypothetical protein